MTKMIKKIAAMGAAVMMMSSMAIGASAYEAIKRQSSWWFWLKCLYFMFCNRNKNKFNCSWSSLD